MIRWLLIGALLAGLSIGLRRGWLQVRWALMLHELGVPFVVKPAPQAACDPKAPAVSSARQAR